MNIPPKPHIPFFSQEMFQNKMHGSLLDIDEAYHYLVNDNESIISFRIGFAALFLCVCGEAEIMLDMKIHRIRKGDLCILFPHSTIQKIGKSTDFEGTVMAVNWVYLNSIQIPSTMNYFLHISENPCISLSESEQKRLLKLCNLIKERQENDTEHIYQKEVINKLLLALCYDIIGIYNQREPIERRVYSRQDTVFRSFIFSLTKNYKEHREVAFYAEQQCLSPRYFSSIIKEKSGENAITWIQRSVIIEAKKLLTNRALTIQQVADELNFPNASFFGQYFKKLAGVTPKKFREMTE